MNALERLGRKRRERRAQTQPEPPFAVESCACLTEGPFALLRVSGTGATPPATLVGEGDSPESFEPLPQPGAATDDGTWRMAFALPAELAVPGTRLWLHDGGVYLVELVVPAADDPAAAAPAPEPQPAVEAAEPSAAAETRVLAGDVDDPRARKLVEAWAESASLRDKLAAREAELARALKEVLDARHNVVPLRERAEELTIELAGVRTELQLSHKQGRDARLRATEVAAELDAVRVELAKVEPGLIEAERAKKAAEQEAVSARDEVVRLERELTSARLAVENAIRDAQAQLADARQEAAAAQDRLTAEAAEQQQTAEKLRTQITKLEEGKSRRRGVGRRSDDRELQKVRTELKAQIAQREKRIEQLEQEAESYAQRHGEALTESTRARVEQLEEEVRQHTACNQDLRALLDSERELAASARTEMHELKRQLATAKASRVTEPKGADDENGNVAPLAPKPVEKAAGDPPPWSALDDELLARIEKAKALTG